MGLTFAWRCFTCGESGSGEGSDKAAEKHTQATRHPTSSWAAPDTVDQPTTKEREG